MTLKEFAQRLDGRQYSWNPWTEEELEIAENNNFVIVSGQSDDLVELRGAINAEEDCFDGGKIYLLKEGFIIGKEEFYNLNDKGKCIQFNAKWCEEVDEDGDSIEWTYDVPFTHEKIRLYEGDSLYCVGFVFELKE